MEPLNFLTTEELLFFLHRKKTEISCIEQPHRFLTQLRDHDLVPEKLFENVKKMRSREQKEKGVYEVLDWVEKNKPQYIHQFWRCVFEDHILQLYPTLRTLRNSLLDGTFKFDEKYPDVEKPAEEEESEGKAEKGKEKNYKRRRSKDDRSSEDSDDPDPSSASTPIPKKAGKKPSFSSPVKKGDEQEIWKWPFYETQLPVTCGDKEGTLYQDKMPRASPVKKGDKQEIWKWPIYETQLPVTCGDKEGTLYRDKMPRGEKCILCQGRWFTPNDFEKFAGKEKWKNWKLSIRCRNTPLKKLIEEKHLKCPPRKRRNRTFVQKNMNKLFPVSSSESSSEDSETSSGSVEESDAEDFQEKGWREGGTDFRGSVEEEEEEEEDVADLSVFQAPSLPVTCVSLSGNLYKYRFATGIRGKCIRTEERWFTPEEFVKQEPTLTDGHWKKDILCHGKTLNFLIKKDILRIHSLLCECVKCSTQEEDVMAQNNDDECYVCHSEEGELVCCDECPRAFHSQCHLPAVHGDSPGEWICTFCVLRTSQQWRDSSNMSEQEALDAPVSQYRLHCHYLLLCVYREDIQKVFVEDPRQTVPRYSEFISQPMWLDRIKQKLKSGEYQTVGAFISDFQLIFSNCRTFNRDNAFGRMGAWLKEMFEEEFKKIFTNYHSSLATHPACDHFGPCLKTLGESSDSLTYSALRAESSTQSSSEDAEVFTPELFKGNDKDKHKMAYRFVCPHAGQFRCSLTSLVFVMEGEGELLYKTVSWDPRRLDGLGEMQPAGPLYNIDCFNGSFSGLHLPHCEIFSEEDKDCLGVAHFTSGNVEIMNPLNVTEAHVVIDIKDLSIFGLIKRMIFPPSPIFAQVLVFLRPITERQKENILDVHLLPWNVPLSEVKDQHMENMHIKTSSKCSLTPGKEYRLCCQPEASTVQPETEMFEFNFGPNYHPTFEVFVNVRNEEVRLSLMDNTKEREVWVPRRILLTGHGVELPAHRRHMESEFVKKNRHLLIQKVSSVMAIADGLRAKDMITEEMYYEVLAIKTCKKKTRLLFKALDSGGASVTAEFYRLLRENEPHLVDELFETQASRPQ